MSVPVSSKTSAVVVCHLAAEVDGESAEVQDGFPIEPSAVEHPATEPRASQGRQTTNFVSKLHECLAKSKGAGGHAPTWLWLPEGESHQPMHSCTMFLGDKTLPFVDKTTRWREKQPQQWHVFQ